MESNIVNTGKLTLKIMAVICDEDNNTVVERGVTLENALPKLEDVDLCTRAGFMRDAASLENAIIKVDTQLRKEISEAYMESAAIKKKA